jgi:hypothetical protein
LEARVVLDLVPAFWNVSSTKPTTESDQAQRRLREEAVTNVKNSLNASKRFGGNWLSFQQPAGWCDGLSSWWLRKRLRNKQFFQDKHFKGHEHPDCKQVLAYQLLPSQKGEDVKKIGGSKALALQKEFQANLGAFKAAALYITDGLRVGKNDPRGKPVGQIRETSELLQVEKDFKTEIKKIGNDKLLASITIRTINGISHACGLDCSGTPVAYFDPNIGEFTFPNVESFLAWWEFCYQNKEGAADGPKEAFDLFESQFKCVSFQRVFAPDDDSDSEERLVSAFESPGVNWVNAPAKGKK